MSTGEWRRYRKLAIVEARQLGPLEAVPSDVSVPKGMLPGPGDYLCRRSTDPTDRWLVPQVQFEAEHTLVLRSLARTRSDMQPYLPLEDD